MRSLLQQIKQRRLALGLKQNDMRLRIGISRQQYQRLESKGNPRLDTLELVAEGLNSQLILIPQERVASVLAVLEQEPAPIPASKPSVSSQAVSDLVDDPWQGLLEDES
jgi:transcriptional regulator with XRE-family HTH domain